MPRAMSSSASGSRRAHSPLGPLAVALAALLLCGHWTTRVCVSAQPYPSIVSYPTPAGAVPVPGVLNPADAPPAPVAVVAASSASAASTAAATTTQQDASTASCATNWCTADGQWLPVNRILVAVSLGLLMFAFRADRRMVAMLLCWACTLYLLLIVDQFALWYIALAVDFALYSLLYAHEDAKPDDTDDDEPQEEAEQEDGEDGDQEGEEDGGETEGAVVSYEQQLELTAKPSQPNTARSRGSARRASVMLTKLQL